MTNTLTWDFKPISLPKINTNLLSVISLIVLLTMAFMTASVIASHCHIEVQARNNAVAEFLLASAAFSAALLSGNPVAIALAAGWVGTEAKNVSIAQQELDKCEYENHGPGASGGCGSGGCG